MTARNILNTEIPSPLPVTLCMINFNGERYLKESLQAVFDLGDIFTEVILVDNASEDKSVICTKEQFPEVKIIQLRENRGPGAARNAGFKAASCDRILFLDNDVVITTNCPKLLFQALQNYPRAAAAMPRILYKNNREVIQYDGAGCHALGLMILHHVNQPISEAPLISRKINSLVTACFLLDRHRWGNGKPFDEPFFICYEDHDFGIRTRLGGHDIISVPSACCYHGEGTYGLSLRKGNIYSKIRVFCLIRNRWIILLKNYQLRTLMLLSPVLIVYEIFQLFGVLKQGWFGEWRKAVRWIIENAGEIRLQRRQIQKARKTPDHQILQGGPLPFREDFAAGFWERKGKQFLDSMVVFYLKFVL